MIKFGGFLLSFATEEGRSEGDVSDEIHDQTSAKTRGDRGRRSGGRAQTRSAGRGGERWSQCGGAVPQGGRRSQATPGRGTFKHKIGMHGGNGLSIRARGRGSAARAECRRCHGVRRGPGRKRRTDGDIATAILASQHVAHENVIGGGGGAVCDVQTRVEKR